MSKEDLLKNSDIISIHLVLGERYKNLITKKELEMMKKTAFLINTSRGPIINENDLVEALKDEKIAGAGLDVYDKEPLPQDHKLRFLPNALLLTSYRLCNCWKLLKILFANDRKPWKLLKKQALKNNLVDNIFHCRLYYI